MDGDTWNAYHLITNRAKAICTSIRQEQFRGLTEMTVNKLMKSGKIVVDLILFDLIIWKFFFSA